MTETTYEQFVKDAAEHGLTDVTQDEFDFHVARFPKMGVKGHTARVRNSRKTDSFLEGKDVKHLLGYALGGLDFTSTNHPLSTTNLQKIAFLKDGELTSYGCYGEFGSKHGRQVELELAKAPDKDYWGINSSRTESESWRPERWGGWKNLADYSYLEDQNGPYEVIAATGTIVNAYHVTDFENFDDNGKNLKYPLDQYGGQLCVSVRIRDGEVDSYVNFGPYKNSAPLVKMEDWNSDCVSDINDFKLTFEGRSVGFIGVIKKVQTKVSKKGDQNWKQLNLDGFCIIELPDDFEFSAPAEADSPKSVPAKVGKSEKAAALLKAVRKGYDDAGPHATAADIHQAYAKEFTEKQVEIALNQIKSTANKSQSKISGIDIKRVRNVIKSCVDNRCTLDYLINELTPLMPEEKIDGCIEHMLNEGELYEPALSIIALMPVK